jgi:predicted DNA-binding ribbon-helix-helix protein
MKSPVIKRSVVIAGHQSSVSVEADFWNCLRDITKQRHETLSQLIASIDADRQHANLSSAIRLYVLAYYRDQYEAGDPSIRQSPSVSHSTISRL